ncbi:MAG: S8 family peptidase [Dysgonamonadaceae bacterium]|jgi:subtilisin family serine protease|nr:S8 family peptidase [Dysgonamonadaceae bacterium]
MKRSLFIFLFFCSFFPGYSLDGFMYRLILKDKGNPPFSTEQPELFLSGKSIQRRLKQNLAVDSADLPIDGSYLEAIANTGADIRAYSKWAKTVTVRFSDLSLVPQLKNLPFVDTLYCVWKGSFPQQLMFREDKYVLQNDTAENNLNGYDAGFAQIALNNGHLLHAAGFRGEGMTIAVIDGGFIHADVINYFDFQRIKGVKSFSHELSDPLQEGADHGTKALSCMLPDRPGELIGTAPEADYYLLRTEVDGEEYPVEEDYWVAALEYADSIGADIVTSSLGYSEFDDSLMNHAHSQLDGKSVPISIAAGLAASRGMLLFNAAGNEGNKPWGKIMFPCDALNMLAIGAITGDSARSNFSSVGHTADGRIKPDLMAMGAGVTVVSGSGQINSGSGTSFATPILAGLSACLWQALPELTGFEIIELLRETANAFSHPDSLTGFGIADVYKAYTRNRTGLKPAGTEDAVYFCINARENRLYLNFNRLKNNSQFVLDIYSGVGIRLLSVPNVSSPVDISSLPEGIYIARLQTGGRPVFVRKFIKM